MGTTGFDIASCTEMRRELGRLQNDYDDCGLRSGTGQFGGAVATKNIGVGSRVLRAKGEVGMIGFSGHEIQRLRGIALLELGFPRRWPWRR